MYCLAGLQEPTTHLWEAREPGILLCLQSLTRNVTTIVSPITRMCLKKAVLAFLHPLWSPGVTQNPQDLLGDEELNLHKLREGKTIAHLP